MKRLPNWLLLAFLAGLSLSGYLAASALTYRAGFPLDDAWIHQTYARSLGGSGEWAFLPGKPSAGSTAPLWSGLLAIGHALRLNPFGWTMVLGAGLLWVTAVLGGKIVEILIEGMQPTHETKRWALWAGVFLILEWHLVWAAGSGMETLLFALFILLVLYLLLKIEIPWLWVGVLIGASAWVRPDGITLLGPAGLALVLKKRSWRCIWESGLRIFTGFVLVFLPYLLFNQVLAGAVWPNTFFAKQAEYAVLRQAPFLLRFLGEASLPLVGAGVILLPGFFWMIWGSIHTRSWVRLAGPTWVIGYLLLYAWRLPVTYQHGRYIIPAMPVFFVWGLTGMAVWVRPGAEGLVGRVVGKTWLATLGLVLLGFWGLGGRGYAQDVAVIESEMVDAAHWVAGNTDPNILIAAHDIGALGYFGGRQILDLAGLVSPEVIPFIRDETQLEAYLDQQRVGYLVTFPDWYPQLARRGEAVYRGQKPFSPSAGGERMTVYRWGGR